MNENSSALTDVFGMQIIIMIGKQFFSKKEKPRRIDLGGF